MKDPDSSGQRVWGCSRIRCTGAFSAELTSRTSRRRRGRYSAGGRRRKRPAGVRCGGAEHGRGRARRPLLRVKPSDRWVLGRWMRFRGDGICVGCPPARPDSRPPDFPQTPHTFAPSGGSSCFASIPTAHAIVLRSFGALELWSYAPTERFGCRLAILRGLGAVVSRRYGVFRLRSFAPTELFDSGHTLIRRFRAVVLRSGGDSGPSSRGPAELLGRRNGATGSMDSELQSWNWESGANRRSARHLR
jgi:hypothetical protein